MNWSCYFTIEKTKPQRNVGLAQAVVEPFQTSELFLLLTNLSSLCELFVHPVYLLASITDLRICHRFGDAGTSVATGSTISYHLPSALWGIPFGVTAAASNCRFPCVHLGTSSSLFPTWQQEASVQMSVSPHHSSVLNLPVSPLSLNIHRVLTRHHKALCHLPASLSCLTTQLLPQGLCMWLSPSPRYPHASLLHQVSRCQLLEEAFPDFSSTVQLPSSGPLIMVVVLLFSKPDIFFLLSFLPYLPLIYPPIIPPLLLHPQSQAQCLLH